MNSIVVAQIGEYLLQTLQSSSIEGVEDLRPVDFDQDEMVPSMYQNVVFSHLVQEESGEVIVIK